MDMHVMSKFRDFETFHLPLTTSPSLQVRYDPSDGGHLPAREYLDPTYRGSCPTRRS